MNDFLFHFLSVFWPAKCPLCGEIIQKRRGICDRCDKETGRITEACLKCGCPQGQCVCYLNDYDLNITAPFVYEEKIRDCIARMKFEDEPGNCGWLSHEMYLSVLRTFPDKEFDLVTCVPLTKAKLKKRGYNQSELLGREIAKDLGAPFEKDILIKAEDTPDQHNLNARQRQKNLKNAFKIKAGTNLKGKTVLLIDDVKTTGATLNECRKALKKGKPKEICCCVAAVTVFDAAGGDQ